MGPQTVVGQIATKQYWDNLELKRRMSSAEIKEVGDSVPIQLQPEEWEQRAHQLPRPYKLPRKRLARHGA